MGPRQVPQLLLARLAPRDQLAREGHAGALERHPNQDQEVTACPHAATSRGKDIPRVYGSFRSEVCKDCGAYRYRDHRDNLWTGCGGGWRPASEYEADCIDEGLE
jgi:hypothetical protein